MNEVVVNIRSGRPSDAQSLATVHDAAWREAYRGIIPGVALERMIAYRGPTWWKRASERNNRPLIVLDLGNQIAGYASYGPSRSLALPQQGEIDELYLEPAYQGVGLGTQLFATARRELAQQGRKGLIVWALTENIRACHFYERLGGRELARSSIRIGGVELGKIAFSFA